MAPHATLGTAFAYYVRTYDKGLLPCAMLLYQQCFFMCTRYVRTYDRDSGCCWLLLLLLHRKCGSIFMYWMCCCELILHTGSRCFSYVGNAAAARCCCWLLLVMLLPLLLLVPVGNAVTAGAGCCCLTTMLISCVWYIVRVCRRVVLFFNHLFYFPAQLVEGFTLSDLLDKP